MKIFEALQQFCWFSRPMHFLERVRYGRGWTFSMRRDQGWTGGMCERILKSVRIPTYNREVTATHFVWRVPRKVARFAEYVLWDKGAPLEEPFLDKAHAQPKGQSPRTRVRQGMRKAWGVLGRQIQ